MNQKLLITMTTVTVFQVALLQYQAQATKSLDIEGNLTERGYALSEAGMREVLTKRDFYASFDCLMYIEQEQMVGLVPDVRSYLTHVEKQEHLSEGSRITVVQCLLAIDKNMTDKTLEKYLARIRRLLFDVKKGDKDFRGVPIHAYNALLAAQKYRAIDIYDDLLYLSCTDTMKGSGKSSPATNKFFELYGDEVREADLDTMLAAWEDQPKRQQFILRRAREHGKRLETGSPKETQATPAAA